MLDRTDPGDYRAVIGSFAAKRCEAPFAKAKGRTTATTNGLRYERRVQKALTKVKAGFIGNVEVNPWFRFVDAMGTNYCSPDMLVHLANGSVVVVEVKLTWVAQALAKLTDLYVPVVERALGTRAMPLVIVKNLVPEGPKAAYTLGDALASSSKLYFWPDNGPMAW
jgi:hypothetical protein